MPDNFGNYTITSANSILNITVPGLYNTPVKIERYGTDAAIAPEQINPVVAEKGVDGHTSFGYMPTNKVLTITIAADSPSRAVFDDWIAYQDSTREVVLCNAELTLPAIGRKYTGLRGGITAATPMPTAGTTLQATTYTITFDEWTASVI